MAKAVILKELCLKLNISISALEREIGVSNSTIVKQIEGDRDISTLVSSKLSKRYPNVNKSWLETGEGEIFNSTTEKISTENGNQPPPPGHENGGAADESASGTKIAEDGRTKTSPNDMSMLSDLIQSNKDMAKAVKDMAQAHLILSELLQRRDSEGGELKNASGM